MFGSDTKYVSPNAANNILKHKNTNGRYYIKLNGTWNAIYIYKQDVFYAQFNSRLKAIAWLNCFIEATDSDFEVALGIFKMIFFSMGTFFKTLFLRILDEYYNNKIFRIVFFVVEILIMLWLLDLVGYDDYADRVNALNGN